MPVVWWGRALVDLLIEKRWAVSAGDAPMSPSNGSNDPSAVASRIDPETVNVHLAKILESEHFVDTTRLKRFLGYVVNESLAGNSDRLKGYTIGLEVFDRGDDFDPQIDTIVRVQAGKLRQRLDLYYAGTGRADTIRIHLPKGSYAPVFEVAVAPEDMVERPSTVQEAQLPSARRLPSVAVLPFDNLSGDPEQEFFADGITEEIINALAQFREIRVIARNSTFQYKNNPTDARTIGSDLDVGYVLEGSVRKAGNVVRITAQLIEAQAGTHLFSENYDRQLDATNLFDIQDNIASLVAAEIADPHGVLSRVGGRSKRWQTDNIDAYECALATMEYWRRPTEDVHLEMRHRLERAVTLDPEYATAWAMLSIMYGDECRAGFNVRSESPPLERALRAAQKAVELDPANASGYHALFLTEFHRGEFDRYRAAAGKALQLNPNYPDMLADMAACTGLSGDWDRAMLLLERALELSPNPPPWYHTVSVVNAYRLGEYDSALGFIRVIGDALWQELGPMMELAILGQLGRPQDARILRDKILAAAPEAQDTVLELLAPWHFPPDLLQHFIDGWRKAGFDVGG